jgi:VWFA-related protein
MRALARGAALVVMLAPSGSAQTPPPLVFESAVEAVFVDVFVTKDGRPVAGLAPAAFELKDNGVRQQLELLSAETRPLLAILVFDTSSSMTGNRMDTLRAAGRAFLAGLRPADEVALVTFGEEVAWRVPPTADKDQIRRALDQLRPNGTTAALDALYAAIALSDFERRPLVVLFTDGEDNSSWLDQGQVLKLAERSNALVHVVCWLPPAPVPISGIGRITSTLSGQGAGARTQEISARFVF